MRIANVDFRGLADRAGLHGYLKECLEFPEYYGNNLDALHDCLTDIGSENELHMVIRGKEELIESFGQYGDTLLQVLRAAAHENEYLSLEFVDSEDQ